MTVSSSTSTASYVGSDQSVLPLTFRFFDDSEINFYRVDPITGASTLQVLGVDYTLTGAGEPEVNGNAVGTIVLTAPLATGVNGFAERVLEAVQNTDLVNQGRFFPEVHEDSFDYLTMLIQQLITAVNNTIQTVVGGFGWDFLGKRGLNLGAPVDPTDAATKGYVDGVHGKALRTPENVPSLPASAGRANKLLSFDSAGNPVAIAAANQSAADLELRLRNNADPLKGSGIIAHNDLLAYPDNTVGKRLAAAATAQQFDDLQTSVDAITADPANAVTEIHIAAIGLGLVSGSGASFSNQAARLPAWLLPNGVVNFLAIPLRVPSHWATMLVDFHFVNTVANAGNISLSAQTHSYTNGESINVTPTGTSIVVAANASPNILTTATPAAVQVTPSKFTTLRISRNGTSGSDTLPNSIALLGISLRKVS